VKFLLSLPTRTWHLIRRRWKLILIVLLIAAGGGYWQYRRAEAAKPDLTFEKPRTQDLTKTIQVSGVVDAKQKASLRFAAGGKVVYLGAQPGDMVKKWQTIATIDRRELEKRLQQDLNAYMRERWDWEATQDATDYHVETLPTRRRIDKEQWDLDDTVLNVEIRDIAIKNTVITAPFAGILTAAPTTVTGVNLGLTDAFELVDPATLVFRAGIDEADISQIQVGQVAEIELDAYPDEKITTYVKSIDFKSSQSSSGTVFIVEFPIEQPDALQKMRLGMNGDVNITVDTRKQVLVIPLDATRDRDDKTVVDVRTGEFTYEEREIEVDLETEDTVEVTRGLNLTDEVLIPQ